MTFNLSSFLKPKESYKSISTQLPLFHKYWWLDCVCNKKWDVAIYNNANGIAAVWPYQIEKKFGFTLIRNPLLTAYLGAISLENTSPLNDDILKSLWLQMPKTDAIQWTCQPNIVRNNFFEEKKISTQKKKTFFIDLHKSENDLWNNIDSKRKNDIRKAQQDLVFSKSQLDIEQFISWHQLAFGKKQKKYPFDILFLKKVIRTSEEHKASLSLIANDHTGKLLGQIWLVFDETKMYYLLSAAPSQAHRGAISLLVWNAILEGKKMGLKYFDFEGSMDEGIARFFKKFGGEEIHYYDYEINNSFLWQLKKKLLG